MMTNKENFYLFYLYSKLLLTGPKTNIEKNYTTKLISMISDHQANNEKIQED